MSNTPIQNPKKIARIYCANCDTIQDPKKWTPHIIIGFALLGSVLNIIGVILYFIFSNPYICKNCGQRNKLTKILNDGTKKEIRALSKNVFLAFSILAISSGLLLKILVVLL